jgi:hypothetical protein
MPFFRFQVLQLFLDFGQTFFGQQYFFFLLRHTDSSLIDKNISLSRPESRQCRVLFIASIRDVITHFLQPRKEITGSPTPMMTLIPLSESKRFHFLFLCWIFFGNRKLNATEKYLSTFVACVQENKSIFCKGSWNVLQCPKGT